MPDEMVLDASVAACSLFQEEHTETVRDHLLQFAERGVRLIAPDFILLELASIAAKKTWRGESTLEAGLAAIEEVERLVEALTPTPSLARAALELAVRNRFSAYDAAYLALAEQRGVVVVTLDAKLVARAEAHGMSSLVRLLP